MVILAIGVFISYNRTTILNNENSDINERMVQMDIRVRSLETAYTRAIKGVAHEQTPIRRAHTSVMQQSYQTEELPNKNDSIKYENITQISDGRIDVIPKTYPMTGDKQKLNKFSLDDLDNMPDKPEIGKSLKPKSQGTAKN